MLPLLPTMGQAAPHDDEWWISTDDAHDYAVWITERAVELDRAVEAGFNAQVSSSTYDPITGFPKTQNAAYWLAKRHEWTLWFDAWRMNIDNMDDSWWPRVNSWESLRLWHQQLLRYREDFKALGANVPDIGAIPRNPEEKVWEDVKPGLIEGLQEAGTKLQIGLVAAGVVLLVVLAYKTSK